MRHGECTFDLHRLAKRLEGFRGTTQVPKEHSKIVLSQAEAREDSDCLLELNDRLVFASERLVSKPQIVERLGIFRPNSQCGQAAVDCVLVMAKRSVDLGHIGVEERLAGPKNRSSRDKLDRSRRVTALVVHHAEIMQSFDMPRLTREHGVVAPRCVGVAPILMHRQRFVEQYIHATSPFDPARMGPP